MKKQSIKNIFFIVLCVFILIPLIHIVFNINVPVEGMDDYYLENSGNAFKNNTQQIDRVDISGVEISYNISNDEVIKTYTGKSGEHIYCPGGKVVCPAGSNLKLSTGVDYKINGDKAGVTYNYYCEDNSGNQTSTHVECSSNILRPGEGNKMNPLTLEDECNDGAEERYRKNFYGFVDPYTASQDDRDPSAGYPNSGLNGFSDPFTHVPFAIFGESVKDPDKKQVFVFDEDGNKLFKSSPCSLYESNDCFNDQSYNSASLTCDESYYANNTKSSSSVTTTQGARMSGDCPARTRTRCAANNGAAIGDELPNGQTGVVQSTQFNCPVEAPFCRGYLCGQKWGECYETRTGDN